MNLLTTLSRSRRAAQHVCGEASGTRRCNLLKALLVAATLLTAVAPALAVDGCLVLLCLAAPDWRQIPQCVSPVQQVLRDLRRGRPFPTCSLSGAGNDAQHEFSAAPANCPPQYTYLVERGDSGYDTVCAYAGVITVRIEGAMWTRVWWDWNGGTVTEYSQTAKQQLGSFDTRFDDDYAAWLATQPQVPPDQP